MTSRISVTDDEIAALITDRTQADVDAANDKGTYNPSDFDRVREAIDHLLNIFREYGYDAFERQDMQIFSDWQIPRTSELMKHLNTLRQFIGVFDTLVDGANVPTSYEHLTFAGANAIEELLYNCALLLANIPDEWSYSDEIFAGEIDL